MQSNTNSSLISVLNCRIQDGARILLSDFSWQMQKGECWLVTGPNGGGKADFIKALNSQLDFVPLESMNPEESGSFYSSFEGSVSVVSLEMAAQVCGRQCGGGAGRRYLLIK